MSKPRGNRHTTLTETAAMVVRELRRLPNIKMIAPGEIRRRPIGVSGRFITVVYTSAGCELLISGQSTQKVAVHPRDYEHLPTLLAQLKASKKLREFVWHERERKPEW